MFHCKTCVILIGCNIFGSRVRFISLFYSLESIMLWVLSKAEIPYIFD